MRRLSPVAFFRQSLKSESYHADELINIYLLRPLAAVIVWLVYPTSITPNHLTIAAMLVGFLAAYLYGVNTTPAIALAGVSITLKDILDDADGQLARAKALYSRRGRFLDSIGDLLVNLAVFSAITWGVYQSEPTPVTILLGLLSLLGITLRVSYHVYYQVSFFHREQRYKLNRLTEEITEEDLTGDPVALRLQRMFLLVYGWQDRMMYGLDRWCRGSLPEDKLGGWYAERAALRLSGMLGFGTEYALLTACSLLNELPLYLFLNVFLMNAVWASNVVYRRYRLRQMLGTPSV